MPTTDARTAPSRRRGRPARISQERIVEAAMRLGLDSFSMQGVADHLGVSSPALYSHVSNRDEVIELVHAALLKRMEAFSSPALGWREWLIDFAHVVRRDLAASASTLMIDLGGPGRSGRLGVGEPALRLLIDEGFSPAEAGYAVWLVFRVAITAGTEQEARLSDFVDQAGQVLAPVHSSDLPATQSVHAALVTQDLHDTFDFDLRIVLDGIAQQLADRR